MFFFSSPGAVAFSIFGLDIYYYGILMGFAITTALFVSAKVSKNNNIIEIAPIILLSGILGARLYYCILNLQYYANHILEILNIRNGGLSIHGALLGGIIAILIEAKKRKFCFFSVSDSLAIGIPLGQSIARWGNFFNSEAFGMPCNLPWKLYIPIQNRPLEYINYNFFHPTFLYESILDLCIFIILLIILKRNNKAGTITFTYLILYSVVRILVESIRIDAIQHLFGLPIPTIVSFTIILISTIGLFILQKRNQIS